MTSNLTSRTLDFLRLLWGIDHALQTRSKAMEATFGITGPQRLVLRLVGSAPGISAGEVAATMFLHPSTITGILRRLQNKGLLERRSDPSDARRSLLSLSRSGKTMNGVKSGTIEASVRRTVGAVSSRDMRVARLVLERLKRDLARN